MQSGWKREELRQVEVNRRENGLSADAYTPLIDLVPALADELLSVLGEAGIAAYALPGGAQEAERPGGPDVLDHVHVDAERKEDAETLLHDTVLHGRVAPERDDDAIFAEIVAGFGDTPDDYSWPDEDADDGPRDRTDRLPSARVVFAGDAVRPDAEDDAEEMLEEDEDAHFVPPPPPPLPTGDPTTRLAWMALVGGPLYILLTVVIGWEAPSWAAFLAVAAFIGGFVTLVLRMGDEPRDDDDGAVI